MGKKIYVGNLSFDTTEDTLRAALERGGATVTRIDLVIDRGTGRPRGFAFVELGSPEEARRATEEWDGRELGGRRLRVNEAEERRPVGGGGARPGPGRGGFGGGGRGGQGSGQGSGQGGGRGGGGAAHGGQRGGRPERRGEGDDW